jgi:hypothetical protein
MGQLNTGVEAYHAAHSQLSEGVIFYGDLLRRLAQLAQTAEDMVYTRGKANSYSFTVNCTVDACRYNATFVLLVRSVAWPS